MNTTRKRLTVAEKEENLINALQKGIIAFSYKKTSGELRRAIGTKNLNFIPIEHHPKSTNQNNLNVITYFDLQKMQWRRIATHKAMSIYIK